MCGPAVLPATRASRYLGMSGCSIGRTSHDSGLRARHHQVTQSETRSASDVNRRSAPWVAPVLALLAAGVAAYLAVTSRYGLPLGCGSGSGCSEVLQSRWAALFGV